MQNDANSAGAMTATTSKVSKAKLQSSEKISGKQMTDGGSFASAVSVGRKQGLPKIKGSN